MSCYVIQLPNSLSHPGPQFPFRSCPQLTCWYVIWSVEMLQLKVQLVTLLSCSTLLCISNLFLHFFVNGSSELDITTFMIDILVFISTIFFCVQNHGSEYNETCLNRTPLESTFVFGINRCRFILVKLTIISYIWTLLNVRFKQGLLFISESV